MDLKGHNFIDYIPEHFLIRTMIGDKICTRCKLLIDLRLRVNFRYINNKNRWIINIENQSCEELIIKSIIE